MLKIIDASWHRNGISGAGFYAITFTDSEVPAAGTMIASLFDEEGCCAVYSIDELSKGNIRFAMGNSWRGDRYETTLRPLLEKFLKKTGGNRVGPFGLPDTRPE